MRTQFLPLTHRANALLGKPCVALDYELTVYWGKVIEVSEDFRVTLQYYHSLQKGWQTKEFYHWRVAEIKHWRVDPSAPFKNKEISPKDTPDNREIVKRFFKIRILPDARSCFNEKGKTRDDIPRDICK